MNTAPSRKRGSYQRGRERREQIALAVVDLVDEVGHDGVTTAQVAARCGFAETSVLYHYPTKDHLLVAALERIDDFEAELVRLDEQQMLDLDALRAVADPIQSSGDHRLRLFVMLKGQAATPGHPAAEYFAQRTERQVTIFGRLIAGRQQAGLAHPGLDPRATARQVVALWEGLTFMRLVDSDFDIGRALIDGVRRLTGENWMRALAALNDPTTGI
ncbi:TetR/AcrR family transcriptional regulator [Cryptosporangium minutisporangium]|uniref:HTH tetR-type domain-containing protein n=1 Tax=Cryptosporangium minutisporangium TaxID=113569 RepID=A0ABP6SRY0_9ACTN